MTDQDSIAIGKAYDFLDVSWKESMPTNPDLTDGKYNGNFALGYDQAQ